MSEEYNDVAIEEDNVVAEKPREMYQGRAQAELDEAEAEVERLEEERRQAVEKAQGRSEDEDPTPEGMPEAPEKDDDELDAEEITFKKRYSDLRRWSQKQINGLKDEINGLKRDLTEARTSQMELPKTEEEVEAWAEEYPDVAAVIKSMAVREARKQDEVITSRLESLEDQLARARREKAEVELRNLHPDYDELRRNPDFHDWVQNHPKNWVREALYENDDDAQFAADAIDLYKARKGITATKQKKSADDRSRKAAEDAAAPVNKGGAAEAPKTRTEKNVIRESEIMKMSEDEFTRRIDEIDAARRAGRILLDVSGGA